MTDKPLAEKAATWERPLDPDRDDQAGALNPPPEREVADEDTHIAREDLGPDSVTFIAKGDPIPPELAGLPRRPARGGSRKRGG
jgi:hypothetical protein